MEGERFSPKEIEVNEELVNSIVKEAAAQIELSKYKKMKPPEAIKNALYIHKIYDTESGEKDEDVDYTKYMKYFEVAMTKLLSYLNKEGQTLDLLPDDYGTRPVND